MVVDEILGEAREHLRLECRNLVFKRSKPLKSEDLTGRLEPEPFTRQFIIDLVFKDCKVWHGPEASFDVPGGRRTVDYTAKNRAGVRFLVEAKPINSRELDHGSNSAVAQIQGVFLLAQAQREYGFGVATDGLRWIFINPNQEVFEDVLLVKDYPRIKELLGGQRPPVAKKEVDISKKFYVWYNALLHGGKYRDNEGKLGEIPLNGCLVNSIHGVPDENDREQIAQVVVDRLIFIKFLQAKGIIPSDVLMYLKEQHDDIISSKLKRLFFNVLNTDKEQRVDVDPRFEDIPYLNGSLFNLIPPEKRGYEIRAAILRRIIDFLDSFRFTPIGDGDEGALDPEILGYIFERAMNAQDRKGTGAYYTPEEITSYICENTIHPLIIDKTRQYLREYKGYPEVDLPQSFEKMLELRGPTLSDVYADVVQKITICDPACGSGAFLLAAGNVLLDVYNQIEDSLQHARRNSNAALKAVIIKNNLYGVDINPNAVEIAKLRLWLWLADSYTLENVRPLPNIEYNIRTGNSLIGYVDVNKFRKGGVTLDEWGGEETPIWQLLSELDALKEKYKSAKGDKPLKDDIDYKINKILMRLNAQLFQELLSEKIKIASTDFAKLNVLHWGAEFHQVFDHQLPPEKRGFDVVIGNPPYVRHEEIKTFKPIFRASYSEVYDGTADVSVYFVKRSLDLAKENGYHSFIITNKWVRAKYGTKLRKYLSENTKREVIVDFNGVKVFVGATVDTLIYIFKNTANAEDKAWYCQYPDTRGLYGIEGYVHSYGFSADGWRFQPKEILEVLGYIKKIGTPLKDLGLIINYGIKTGLNTAFFIDEKKKNELIRKDPNSAEIIKPLIRGRNIKRFTVDFKNEWLIVSKDGINIPREYPAVYEHLRLFREPLETRWDKGTYWYNLRPCKYYEDFEKPKIIYPEIGNNTFFYDKAGFYTNNKCFILPTDKRYLTLFFSSKLLHTYFTSIGAKLGSKGYEYRKIFMDLLPIVIPEKETLFEILTDYLHFLSKLRHSKKENFDENLYNNIEQISDSLIYTLYFKEKFLEDGVPTNLLELVEPYLVDIEDLSSDEEKMATIQEVYAKITADKEIMGTIEKIKAHEWVKAVEGAG